MRICIIAEGYPTKDDPFLPFVRALFVEITKKGHECNVIAPQSITRAIKHHLRLRPRYWKDVVDENKYIHVYQPYYCSLSNGNSRITQIQFQRAVEKVFCRIHDNIDVLYAHFWHMGIVAAKLAAKKPIFLACGESKISVKDRYTEEDIQCLLSQLSGVIYVGTKSYHEAVSLGLQRNNNYIIAPNGYNPLEFYNVDKRNSRAKLGFGLDDKIVSFVGAFSKRKGVDRLLEALKKTQTQPKVILIGQGDYYTKYNNIVFKGSVSHEKIVDYLNASDVFVLPTNNEGCCNAIVEALACGLPVISSNQEFNDDILDDSCSLRINPMDIGQISSAIDAIFMDPEMMKKLQNGAVEKAKKLKLEERAKIILSFIEQKS